ncbi:MAG: hypothetical protein PWQ06_1115 [Anaerophaga sp.]|jgi:hypothetical protein|nr:hypothetical protein [Anaerophaga sp.]
MVKTEKETIQTSVVSWNIDRVGFLINSCNIKTSELLKALHLESVMNVAQLNQFARDGSGLSEETLWKLHYSINGFFRG